MNLSTLTVSELQEINGGANWGLVAVGVTVVVLTAVVYGVAVAVTDGAAAAPLARPAIQTIGAGVGAILVGLAS